MILTLYISQDGFHEKWDHGLVAELTMEHVQLWAINTVVATSQRPYELQNTLHFSILSASPLTRIKLPRAIDACFFDPPGYSVEVT